MARKLTSTERPIARTPELEAEWTTRRQRAKKNRLAALEFYEDVGAIIDKRLYLFEFANVDEYCEKDLGLSSRTVQRELEALPIIREVLKQADPATDCRQLPPSLPTRSQAKQLAAIPKEKRHEVIKQVQSKGGFDTPVARKLLKTESKRSAPLSSPTHKPEDPLKPHIRAAFDATDFAEILTAINQVGEKIKALGSQPLGRWFARDGKSGQPVILSDLRQIWQSVNQCKPYSECVYCCQRCDNCKACHELGWLTKISFDQAPPEMQKRSKVVTK